MGAGALNNTVNPSSCIDNGAGLQWDVTVPAAGSSTVQAATSFGEIPVIIQAPQLTLTKTASPSAFTVGQAASYRITATNTGAAATSAVATISDTINAGLTIGTLPAGCSASGQVVTCTIAGGLAIGASVSFVIPVTPTITAVNGNNTATVSGGGDSTCPAAARCIGSVIVSVVAPPSAMIPVPIGNAWTLTLMALLLSVIGAMRFARVD